MSAPVSSIRNLGPAMQAACQRAGIDTADQLREMGADDAYRRLIATGTRPHFIGYYAMVMGLQGRPWNDCRGQEKADLRARFDQLCDVSANQTGPSHALKDAMNKLGVRLD